MYVSEQFVKQAYSAACSEWQDKIAEQFPELFDPVVKIGQIYINDNFEYLLAQVGPSLVCLIGMHDGNRFKNPVEVERVSRITPEEFNKIKHRSYFILKQ